MILSITQFDQIIRKIISNQKRLSSHGLPKRSPTLVLTMPKVAQLRSSDGIRCFQLSMDDNVVLIYVFMKQCRSPPFLFDKIFYHNNKWHLFYYSLKSFIYSYQKTKVNRFKVKLTEIMNFFLLFKLKGILISYYLFTSLFWKLRINGCLQVHKMWDNTIHKFCLSFLRLERFNDGHDRKQPKTKCRSQYGVYADGGCCGCNTKRRRIMCIVITVVCLIISGILAIIDVNANGNTCISLLILGGLFLLAGIFCPDGCCGQYRKNRPNNQNGQYSSV